MTTKNVELPRFVFAAAIVLGFLPHALEGQTLQWPIANPQMGQNYACYGCGVADEYHGGIDVVSASGSLGIYAAGDGTIHRIVRGCLAGDQGCGRGFGNHVVIMHSSALFSIYGHLEDIPSYLHAGDPVGRGATLLGTMGTTGWSSGVHLHFALINYNPGNSGEYTGTSIPNAGFLGYTEAHPSGSGLLDPNAYLQGALSPPGKSLLADPSGGVHWLQNGRIYHVTDKASVVDVMENNAQPGWIWGARFFVSNLSGYVVGPEFLEGDSRSNGLLLRQVGDTKVYLVENGQRRWVVSESALNSLGRTFGDVIDVPSAIVNLKVPGVGPDYTGGSCSYSLSPTSRTHGSGFTSSTFSVNSGSGCSWNATKNASWITIDSGNGSGNGSVSYSVTANPLTSQRSGAITVEGQTFTVTQSGLSCSYSLSSTGRTHGSGSDSSTFSVAAPSGCSWSATKNVSWITITSGSSSGSGTVYYTVEANPTTSQRSGTITIEGQAFTVTQSGLSCSYSLSPTSRAHGSGSDSGSFSVTASSGCSWSATENATWITLTSGSSSGNGTVLYSITANTNPSQRSDTINVQGQTFTVTQLGNGSACTDDAYEEDDVCNGPRMGVGDTRSHLHCDEDWTYFVPIAGATYEIETSSLSGGADTVIELFRDCTTFLASDDDGAGFPASRITYTATVDDNYLDIQITEYSDGYESDEGYDISVTCIAACDTCSAPTELSLTYSIISAVTEYDACNSISAGPDFSILAPGDVTFTAGSSIVLGNGFMVEAGAKFKAVIDPYMK